jgi:hypothetical protein
MQELALNPVGRTLERTAVGTEESRTRREFETLLVEIGPLSFRVARGVLRSISMSEPTSTLAGWLRKTGGLTFHSTWSAPGWKAKWTLLRESPAERRPILIQKSSNSPSSGNSKPNLPCPCTMAKPRRAPKPPTREEEGS